MVRAMRIAAAVLAIVFAGCIDPTAIEVFGCDGGVCAVGGGDGASGGGSTTGGGAATGGGTATGGGAATGGGVATGGGDAMTGGGAATGGGTAMPCGGVVCGDHASCVANGAAFTCVCDVGYDGAPVTNGPATCTDVDECLFTNCGANTMCSNIPGSWQCACAQGYVGATVTGGTTTCTPAAFCTRADLCGNNATCIEGQGTYSCRCDDGYAGATTTGMPATCVELPYRIIGSTTDGGTGWNLLVPFTIDAGATVVVVSASGGLSSGDEAEVSDSRGNVWQRVVEDDNSTGSVGIYASRLRTTLVLGDAIRATNDEATAGVLWAALLTRHTLVDRSDDYSGGSTTMHTQSVPAVPNDAVLSIAALYNPSFGSQTFSANPPDPSDFQFTGAFRSGLVQIREQTPLGNTASLRSASSVATSPLGVMATFFRGPVVSPTSLSLMHSPNERSLAVGWTGGRGNGTCLLQYNRASTWSVISSYDCDVTRPLSSVSLPASLSGAWSSMPLRLVRGSDGQAFPFPGSLACNPVVESNTATPTFDEDCDGQWDDKSCVSYAWTPDLTATSCPSAGGTNSLVCGPLTETNLRFTTDLSVNPATGYSAPSTASSCVDGGAPFAQRWTCVASGCTWN